MLYLLRGFFASFILHHPYDTSLEKIKRKIWNLNETLLVKSCIS